MLLAFALVLLCVPATADEGNRYEGRRLVDVLEEMRDGGLNIVFSSAVVGPELLVSLEPRATGIEGILAEILPPLGLTTRPGPSGAILIVPASRFRPEGSIRGRVLSAGLGTPVPRALLTIRGTSLRGSTGPAGEFFLSPVPAGAVDLAVEAPGFEEHALTGIQVDDGGAVRLEIRLKARPTYVAEVVVTPGKVSVLRQEQAAGLAVSRDDAVLVATLGGDVGRVVEALPGVAAADNSAAFNVRGAESGDVGMVLDGLELFEPFHLQRYQNPFTFIDAHLLNNLDFYAGGFTADLGDRHGGFIRMSTDSRVDRFGGAVQLGTINSRISLGAPLPDNLGSWSVSGRTWYPEALRDTIELGEEGMQPRFQDLYARVALDLTPRTALSAHGLFAQERIRFTDLEDNESSNATTHSGYLWLRALNSWNEDWYSETVLSTGRFVRTRTGITAPEDDVVEVLDAREVDFVGLKHDSTWNLTPNQLLRAGLEARRLASEYHYRLEDADGTDLVTPVHLDPSGSSLGAYLADRFLLHPRLALEAGIRWDRQSYIDDDQFAPRINGIWRPDDRSELRFGFGRYFQSQRIHELHVEDGETGFREAELSEQAELTWDHRLRRGWRIRLGMYHRSLSALKTRYENIWNPVEPYPETSADRIELNPESAVLEGAELFVSSPPGKPLHGWASYTLARAEDRLEGRDVPRSWDQEHAFKFMAGYRNRTWSVSLSGSAHTGWPTTPVTGEIVTLPGGSTDVVRVLGPRNSARYPGYLRLDAKVGRAWESARGTFRLDLEVVNLTDRSNVCCYDDFFLTPNPDGSVDVEPEVNHWLGITPSLSATWEF